MTLTTKYDYQPNEDPKDTIVDYGTTGHLNLTTYYLYNSVGDLTQMTDPRGSVTVSYFDADRRKYEDDYHNGGLGAALNYATQTKYDAVGRDYEDDVAICFDSASPCHTSGTTVATWQPVKKTGYTYTSKVHTVMDADGRTIATDYDDADRAAKVTDPVSRVTVLTYCANGDANCAANQVKNEIRAWHGGTSCTYGSTLQECYRQVAYYPNGEQKSVTDANGNTTNFVYDLWRRLRRTRYADTTPAHPDEEVLTLDENSNVTARQMRSGGIISYGYNDLDWMTTKAMPISGGTLNTSWTYRLNGKIATLGDDAAGGGNSLTYGYDSADRMTSTATLIPGFSGSQTASYNLDANGNRTKLIWPSTGGAYAVGYCYDNMNRMSQASENPSGTDCTGGSSLATYAYDPLSNRTGVTYGNGASETASFYVSTGTAHYSPDLQTLTHKMPSTGPAYTFGYSNAHQLNSEAISDASYVWQPTADATTSYMPNNLNQYTTVNGFAYTYDGNGNMTSDHIWTYGYDLENHLLTANKTAGGTVAASYNYDPLGRRNEKSGTGVTQTYFLSDGTDEITEYNSPGTATVRYIPGPSIDEPIAMITVSSGAKEYFHTNKQGSVIAMTNGSTGALAEGPYKYDPYGNCFSGASPCSPVAGSTAPYRFTGRRLDPETGLYYYRARYYASGDTNGGGRFLQTDAVGYTADLDLYTYVGNDPTDKGDPSGNFVYGMPHDACLLFCDPSSPDQGTNVDGLSGVTASIETGVIGGAASQITGNSGSNSGAQMRAYTPVTGPLGTLRGTGVVNGPAVDISYDPGDIITFQMDPDLMGGTEKTPQSPTPSARSSRAARSHPGSGGEEQGMLGWDRSAAWQAYQVQENGVGELKPPVYLGGLSFAAPVQTAGPFKSVILPSVLEIRFSDLNETAGGPPVFVDIWTRPAEPHS
ncbi:MAG: RHS repeat-associated core domain-containing protein [Rhizomicrobium sp.]